MRTKLVSMALLLSMFTAFSVPLTVSADYPTCKSGHYEKKSWTDQYGHHETTVWVCDIWS